MDLFSDPGEFPCFSSKRFFTIVTLCTLLLEMEEVEEVEVEVVLLLLVRVTVQLRRRLPPSRASSASI